jgi:ligand-binding sensor domain-containing protein
MAQLLKNTLSFLLFWAMFAPNGQSQTWTHYDEANSGLPFNTVNAVQVDPSGNLWIGTDYGLARLDTAGAWTVWQTADSDIPGNAVRSLHLDPASGGLWVGTFQNGVALFDGISGWTAYNSANSGLSDDYVRSIAIDSQGGAWFGTAGGLCRLLNGNWDLWHQQNTPAMRSSNISALGVDQAGTVWIGTVNGGLSYYTNGTIGTYYNGNSQLTDNTILGLDFDAGGNLWLATPTGGINIRQTDGTWSRLTTMNAGLPTNSFNDVCLRGNQVFMASQYHGLLWENGGAFVHYDDTNSPLPENTLLCLTEDGRGRIWIGTYNSGLVAFYPDSVQTGALSVGPLAEAPQLAAPANGPLRFSSDRPFYYELFQVTGQRILSGRLAAGTHCLELPTDAHGVILFRATGLSERDRFVWKFLRE